MAGKSLEARFQSELIDAACWDDLVQVIVHYPSSVMTAYSVHLFVRSLTAPDFSYAAHWSEDGKSPANQLPDQPISHCTRCLVATAYQDMVIDSCLLSSGSQHKSSIVRYCAPLVFRGEVVAILLIYIPTGTEPTCQQLQAVTRVLPEMSLAIASFRLHRSMKALVDEVEASRQHFAQDLHDSLAHTIGYLRLKLNQFSIEGTQPEFVESQASIDCMRDAADEAYELIRHTLAEMEPTYSNDLTASILEQANVIGQRGGFKVQMTSSGQSIQVAPEVQRQVLYVCREALNNVGRHAHAQSAEIHLLWGKDCFTLRIKDDGIGFDPDEASLGDHFGLAIMKQRAQSVGGTCTIRSSPGKGAQIFLWSPAALTRDGPRLRVRTRV